LKANILDQQELYHLTQDKKEDEISKFKDLSIGYTQIWKIFFEKSLKNENLDKPLSRKILRNSSHKIT